MIDIVSIMSALSIDVSGEVFEHEGTTTPDHRRYDFVNDLMRLERVVLDYPAAAGYAIFLTNAYRYWTPPKKDKSFDAAFRLHEGRLIEGTLEWSAEAGMGTVSQRQGALVLRGSYRMHWRDYSVLGGGAGGRFRYLLVEVQRGV